MHRADLPVSTRKKLNKIIKKVKIRQEIQREARDILKSENFRSTRRHVQHGDMSVHEHCRNVAFTSVRLADFLHLKVKRRELIRGALLHDYFLYDWHKQGDEEPHDLHGFYHPGRALRNAIAEYELTNREKDIIKKHMWPLTVVPPKYREGWVVTMADKWCSLCESIHLHHGHGRISEDRRNMGKIVYLMGKSSSGKDTIFRKLMEDKELGLTNIVPYTTRPIRAGEREGQEYHFTDEEGFKKLEAEGKIIEHRGYNTVHGLWRYFTVNDGQLDNGGNLVYIGTIESYISTIKVLGQDRLIPVLIDLDDGVRLQRALNRERKQENPKYEEMCRRFLADSADFAEEKIREAGITRRFRNDDLEKCLAEIKKYIIDNL